jgi:hypothetical protein
MCIWGFRQILFSSVLFYGLHAFANQEPVPECKALRWGGATERELMQMQFSEIDRNTLIQIAWGEAAADPHHSVAGPIMYYLYSTETHRPLRQYFEDLAKQLGGGKFSMRGLVARYPIRKGNSRITKTLSSKCQGYIAAKSAADNQYTTDYSGGPKKR